VGDPLEAGQHREGGEELHMSRTIWEECSMRLRLTCLCFGLVLAAAPVARAQTLDQEMSVLAGKLSRALVAQGFKHVAAIDFTDLQGQPTELGRFLSEHLAVEIVSSGGVRMVDRANIKSILAEHKLTEEGLVNPANAKKLGEFAGVDAILIGNVTALDEGMVLMVKAIATSSADIVAAGRARFPKTSEIQQLFNRGISASAPSGDGPAGAGTDRGGATYRDAQAIATKDFGSLRVVLRSVMAVKLSGGRANGLRCSFQFINLETRRPIVVGLNAITSRDGINIGELLRSTAVDERGTLWRAHMSNVAGMGVVGVGRKGFNEPFYDPPDIVSLLKRLDDTRSNTAMGYDPREQVNFFGREQHSYTYVFGSTTSIAPGQGIMVTMTYLQEANQSATGPSPEFFQLDTEIVVGTGASDSRRSYALHNLTFDRVKMPPL
jgi:hypothetical protein